MKEKTGSMRFNEGKPLIHELDPRFIMELGKLFEYSSKKYAPYNYALGQKYSTAYNSMMRHALKFWSGQDIDKESGLHHLVHIAANAMIIWNSSKQESLDDRFKWIEEDKEKYFTGNGTDSI